MPPVKRLLRYYIAFLTVVDPSIKDAVEKCHSCHGEAEFPGMSILNRIISLDSLSDGPRKAFCDAPSVKLLK